MNEELNQDMENRINELITELREYKHKLTSEDFQNLKKIGVKI